MRRSTTTAILAAIVGALVATPIAVYASHSFNDVPGSNTFHEDIAWLKQSGVTLGCNPPANTEFCPDDFVTREQMSAFLRRFAQYLGAEDGTPAQADNAGTLEGLDPAEIGSRVASAFDLDLPDQNTNMEAAIEAPRAGHLVINAAVDIRLDTLDSADTVHCRLRLNGTSIGGSQMNVSVGRDGLTGVEHSVEDICFTTSHVPVDAGSHTVAFSISDVDEAALGDGALDVVWVPFNADGSAP